MGKAIIFVRVSTDKQHLESQEEELKRKALADGFKESNLIYIGKKESGYKLEESEREGLSELEQYIDNEDIDSVYIWEISRLSRKPQILYNIRDKFFSKKIQLKCSKPEFTLLTEDRKHIEQTTNILFSLFGALAEQEIIEKKERFARGKRRLAEEGRYNGGAIPFGYQIDKERGNLIIINEDEAQIVREIYNLYENGLSQLGIAKEFYAKDMKRFTISFVHQILTNRLLTGAKTKSKGASYERSYPQIITIEQFEKCREIAKKNNLTLSKSRNIYFADKLIKCPQCGGYWSSSGSKCLYRCYKAHFINKDYNGYDGITLCTNRTNISINIIDSLLWHLAQILETEYILNMAEEDIENYKKRVEDYKLKLSNVENQLEVLTKKRTRLQEMYIDGLPKANYDIQRKKIEKEEKEILENKIRYENEITHIEALIEDILTRYELDNDDEIAVNLTNKICKAMEKIEMINDDKIRSEIIHKHIREISIESCTIMHKFNCHKEAKPTKARKITIQTYLNNDFHYIFMPFDGKGGSMFACDADFNIINKEQVPYLNRFVDTIKLKQRKVEKENREKLRINKLVERQIKGLLTFREAAAYSQIGYATLWYAAKNGRLNYTIINKTKYLHIEDVNNFKTIKRKSPNTTQKNEV